MIVKCGSGYKINFVMFTQEEFSEFSKLFKLKDETISTMLTELILSIHKTLRILSQGGLIARLINGYHALLMTFLDM